MVSRWCIPVAFSGVVLFSASLARAQAEVAPPPVGPAPAAPPGAVLPEPTPSEAPAPFESSAEFGGGDFLGAAETAAAGVSLRVYGDTELAARRLDRWRGNFAAAHFD